jgi:hypothetical protein
MTGPGTRVRKSHVWKRDNVDFYVEEPRASIALFEVERFVGAVWDPACGSMNIIDAAVQAGLAVRATDIEKRSDRHYFFGEILSPEVAPLAPNIVTNPPFFRGKGTEAFIRKALSLACGKVCIFTSIKFLAGAARANGLFAEHTPHRVWIVTPRVSCPPGAWLAAGNTAGGGTDDWCWLVWDMTAPRAAFPQLGWLRSGKADRERAS